MKLGIALIIIGSMILYDRAFAFTMNYLYGYGTISGATQTLILVEIFLLGGLPLFFGIRRVLRTRKVNDRKAE